MRQPIRVLRYFVLVLALGFAARAYADDRSEARAHYQAGVKSYTAADYRGAIREFSAAQQSAPADLNNYNLALCYDKLGDAEPAIQYYRAFLDKQPGTDKRAEIEASIDRLEAASRSAASKKADEARKADDAKAAKPPAVVAPAPAPDALVAPPVNGPSAGAAIDPTPAPLAPAPRRKSGPAIQGTLGPSTGSSAATGDPQVDHINSIDIDQIREQRMAGTPDGRGDGRGGPAASASGAAAQPGPAAPNGPMPSGTDQPRKETAVYKKWWFWAVVAVSGYVVYELATASSSPRNDTPSGPGRGTAKSGGLTLLSW